MARVQGQPSKMVYKAALVKVMPVKDPGYETGVNACEIGAITSFIVGGVVDEDYGYQEIDILGEFVETSCIPEDSEAYPYRGNYCPYTPIYVILTNQFLFEIPPGYVAWIHEQNEVSMESAVIPMSGDGGVDIPLLALYTGIYQGGWFATIEITDFDEKLISADFESNPTRYWFGAYSVLYHGFVYTEQKLEYRKTFLPLRVWFPTLEPGGAPEEVNVWVPVPTWERASGVKWHLLPGVTGVCRVWWMKLWTGMDAYF